MSQEIADFVRGKCKVVAVSDCYLLAPWADALVSHDPAWWQHHKEAMRFAGRKFCGRFHPGTEQLPFEAGFTEGCNSGLQGMRAARIMGATRILLLGFDLSDANGQHFFGAHPTQLASTTPQRFADHLKQFGKWKGAAVVNCTPNSALTLFPMGDLREIFCPG
jgi:hypothetical protein